MSDVTTPEQKTQCRVNTHDGGGIMASIAALRQILMIDSPTKSLLSKDNHTSIAVEPSRREEWNQYEEEISKLKSTIIEMESQIQQIQIESEKAAKIHRPLESAYEALSKHKKELNMQLELVVKSRDSLEDKLLAATKSLEGEVTSFAQERLEWSHKIDLLKREKEDLFKKSANWEAKYQHSLRTITELQTQLENAQESLAVTSKDYAEGTEKLQNQIKNLQDRLNQERAQTTSIELESTNAKELMEKRLAELERSLEQLEKESIDCQESLKNRLEQSEAARKKEAEEFQPIKRDLEAHVEQVNVEETEVKETQHKTELKVVVDSSHPAITTAQELENLLEQSPEQESNDSNCVSVHPFLMRLKELYDDVEVEGASLDLDKFNRKVERLSLDLKFHFLKLEAGKAELESQLQIVKHASEKSSVDLASSREKWRQTRDELEDTKEELKESRAKISELEEQLLQFAAASASEDKRVNDDTDLSEVDQDVGHESHRKRPKIQDFLV